MSDLESKNVSELREMAKEAGAKNVSKMNEADLRTFLQAQEQARQEGVVAETPHYNDAPEATLEIEPNALEAQQPVAEPQQSAPRALTPAANEYTADQVIEGAPTLIDRPSYLVEVALRRYGGEREFYTLEQARKAVDELMNQSVEA